MILIKRKCSLDFHINYQCFYNRDLLSKILIIKDGLFVKAFDVEFSTRADNNSTHACSYFPGYIKSATARKLSLTEACGLNRILIHNRERQGEVESETYRYYCIGIFILIILDIYHMEFHVWIYVFSRQYDRKETKCAKH